MLSAPLIGDRNDFRSTSFDLGVWETCERFELDGRCRSMKRWRETNIGLLFGNISDPWWFLMPRRICVTYFPTSNTAGEKNVEYMQPKKIAFIAIKNFSNLIVRLMSYCHSKTQASSCFCPLRAVSTSQLCLTVPPTDIFCFSKSFLAFLCRLQLQ